MTVSLYFACKRAGGAGRLLFAIGASSPPPFCFFSPFGLPSAFGALPSAFGAFFAFSSAMSMFVMCDDIGRRVQFLFMPVHHPSASRYARNGPCYLCRPVR